MGTRIAFRSKWLWIVSAGLVAGWVTSKVRQNRAGAVAAESAVDTALEDSFPASDPPSSTQASVAHIQP